MKIKTLLDQIVHELQLKVEMMYMVFKTLQQAV